MYIYICFQHFYEIIPWSDLAQAVGNNEKFAKHF